MKDIPLLAVCGPTASGKTGLAIRLAKRYGGEIVSADSMQIYRRMNIGTAKPDAAEMEGIPHHLLDFLEPGEDFSVAQYVKLAQEIIGDIHGRGKLPILAGGTGLYIDSLTRNIQFAEMPEDPALRQELTDYALQNGNEALWRLLQECDPVLAEALHPNNRGRIIRGIEVFRLTGEPLSLWQQRSRLEPAPYRLCILGLNYADRESLYRRIDQRVDQMLDQGLLEEAQGLFAGGLSKTAAQAIGYKELRGYLEGDTSLEEAVEKLKRETRRYAKRQLTWLRRDERIHWLYPDQVGDSEALLEQACDIINQALFR